MKWGKIPNKEIERLSSRSLYTALQKMRIPMPKKERLDFTKELLKKQNDTCAFAGGNDEYCWNAPKTKLGYLKLEWAHKVPRSRSRGRKTNTPDNLYLLCSRCNNQIQSSKKLDELIPELEHKIKVIKRLKKSDIMYR